MRKSEVFDNFIKLAKEQGMIPPDAPDKAKKTLENNPRADSMSVSDIEALYGVKPDLPKSMEYERNIIEDAHPNMSIVSPSHDKINGLFENENEAQDIAHHWINKMPNGQLLSPKYAQQELVLSLVRIANDLDNRNQNELRALADICLEQAMIPIRNAALLPAALISLGPWVIPIAATIGALYLQQHMSFINEGFEKNHQKLIAELDDLINSTSSWGVGYEYTSEFKQMAQDLKDKITGFYSLYQKAAPFINEMERPKTAKDLIEMAQKPETNSVINAYNALVVYANNMNTYLDTVKKNFSSETFKAKQIADKGFFTSLLDKTHMLHGGHGLIADDFDDVVRALDPYRQSIEQLLAVLKNAESLKKDAMRQIQEASFKGQIGEGEQIGEPAPSAKRPDEGGVDKLHQELGGLSKELEEEFPELT